MLENDLTRVHEARDITGGVFGMACEFFKQASKKIKLSWKNF